jgi:hypothetical protein
VSYFYNVSKHFVVTLHQSSASLCTISLIMAKLDHIRWYIIQSIPFKMQYKTITYYGTKWNKKALPTYIVTLESMSSWLLGRCSRRLRKNCVGVNMMYSRTERVFIREYYIASKSFAAVHEEFSNEYPNNKIPSNTRKCRMITKFRETVSFCP